MEAANTKGANCKGFTCKLRDNRSDVVRVSSLEPGKYLRREVLRRMNKIEENLAVITILRRGVK